MESITITEFERGDNLIIKGCKSREEALLAAREWLDEHASLLIELCESQNEYVAIFTSDDYTPYLKKFQPPIMLRMIKEATLLQKFSIR